MHHYFTLFFGVLVVRGCPLLGSTDHTIDKKQIKYLKVKLVSTLCTRMLSLIKYMFCNI